MTRTISESDWKLFRQLQPIALERFCQRILAEVSKSVAEQQTTSHQRYLAVYKLLEQRDQELTETFDDFRRSSAWRQRTRIQSHQLLTEEELSRFSSETREVVGLFLGT